MGILPGVFDCVDKNMCCNLGKTFHMVKYFPVNGIFPEIKYFYILPISQPLVMLVIIQNGF